MNAFWYIERKKTISAKKFVEFQLTFFHEAFKLCNNKLCGRPPQYAPAPCKLTFDLLTLNVVSESRMTWATSVPILVFLGLCFRLRPDVRDRQTDVRRASSLNALYPRGGDIIILTIIRRRPVSVYTERGESNYRRLLAASITVADDSVNMSTLWRLSYASCLAHATCAR